MRRAKRAAGAAITASGTTLAAAAALLGSSSQPAGAAVTVTTTANSGPGSLRGAIATATPGDTIDFQAGLVGTINLNSEILIDKSLTIDGPGADVITVSGQDVSRVFSLYSSNLTPNDVTISGLTIAHGNASGAGFTGGGIVVFGDDLHLIDDVLTLNAANSGGGGVQVNFNGGLSVESTIITGNQAGTIGGGINVGGSPANRPISISNSVISSNAAARGGGLGFSNQTDLDVIDTTITGNTATTSGGGVRVDAVSGSDVTFRSSTVSGNTAPTGAGVELYRLSLAPTQFDNTTISDNLVGSGISVKRITGTAASLVELTVTGNAGGGLTHIGSNPTPMKLTGSIVAANTGDDISNFDAANLTSDHSLLGTIAAGTTFTNEGGTITGQDPKLGPLDDYGGPTKTHILLNDSPARDTGPDPVPVFTGNTVDQRGTGFDRVVNGVVDMGAYEVQLPADEPPAYPTRVGDEQLTTAAATDLVFHDGATTITVHVPVGALPYGTVVSVMKCDEAALAAAAPPPANTEIVDCYAVEWKAPDGSSPDATSPVTLTVDDAAVKSSDELFQVNGSNLDPVTATVTNGSWSTDFTVDPPFVLIRQVPPTPPTTAPPTTAPPTTSPPSTTVPAVNVTPTFTG